MITMRLVNAAELRKAHDVLLAQNERMTEEASEAGATHTKDHVRAYPRFKRRTGNLQRSVSTKIIRTRGGRLLKIDNTAPYADAIDGGARPHKIRARRAKFLRFYWPKAGRLMFLKSVNHPGNRPYKFMYRAWHSAGRVEEQVLRRRMGLLARRF